MSPILNISAYRFTTLADPYAWRTRIRHEIPGDSAGSVCAPCAPAIAPAGAAGVKALATSGSPEQVISWEASGEKYDSWFYWQKKQALHFKGGMLITTSDWSKGPGGTAKK